MTEDLKPKKKIVWDEILVMQRIQKLMGYLEPKDQCEVACWVHRKFGPKDDHVAEFLAGGPLSSRDHT